MAERVQDYPSRRLQQEHRKKPPNLVLIAALVVAVLVTLFGLFGLIQYREAREQTTAVTEALGKANARALTAFALYEIGQRDDPSGSLALLLAREAVQYFLDNDLPLDTEADAALRKAVDTAPPWRMTLSEQDHADSVLSAAFSPDGRFILTASEDGSARVWDAQTGQQLHSLEGHGGWVRSAAYSPDSPQGTGGQTIVTAADDGAARIWGAQTGQLIRTLEGHTNRIWSAAYSPDGQYIVTASDDGSARTWDARTGQPLRSLEGHADGVWSAAYSPDGRHIVTASADFTTRVWVAGVEDLLNLADSLVQREPPILTQVERERFLGE